MPDLTPEHKQALGTGRTESNAVDTYLQSIKPKKRGPRRTEEKVIAELSKVQDLLDDHTIAPIQKLEATQARMDLEAELHAMRYNPDQEALEARFIEHAAAYSARKKISYSAWREMGVPATVLRAAGVTRKFNPREG